MVMMVITIGKQSAEERAEDHGRTHHVVVVYY
jgi:hypothetical protein